METKYNCRFHIYTTVSCCLIDVCTHTERDSGVCVAAETQSLPINIFRSEAIVLERPGFELMTY